MSSDRVTLKVGGVTYSNWLTADITYGIETVARSFALTVTMPGDVERSPVHFGPGDAFQLYIGADKVIDGYVDAVAPQYDANSSSVAVTGRSKTGQLVDCSVVGSKRYNDQTIEKISRKLAALQGVKVTTDLPKGESIGAPIRRFVVDHGEKIFDAIERVARTRALLLYDDADGRLVLQRGAPGSFPLQIGAEIERGRNVLAGDGNFDVSGVFNEYRIKSQTAGDDDSYGEAVTGIEAVATDPDLIFGGYKRTLVLPTDSGANRKEAKARAEWEAANRAGRSSLVNYKLRGWRDGNGDLWQPGTLVSVTDGFLSIKADLLVVSVGLSISNDGGLVTDLTLAPEAGYYATLPDKPRAGLGAWGYSPKVPARRQKIATEAVSDVTRDERNPDPFEGLDRITTP